MEYKFWDIKLRAALIKDEPWFAAIDVCQMLGLSLVAGTGQHLKHLDAFEKQVLPLRILSPEAKTGRGGNRVSLISESGLYKLILRARTSNNPKAKDFQDWVTQKVLPSIRKEGGYIEDQEKIETGEVAPEDIIRKGYEMLMRLADRYHN